MPIVGGQPGGNSITGGSTTDAFQRPPRRTLPLSKGGDLIVDFLQMIDGEYTSYAAGVTVTLQIDSEIPVAALAVINSYHALCRVESNLVDAIPKDVLWRCIVSYPTFPTTEIVAMNGTVARADS